MPARRIAIVLIASGLLGSCSPRPAPEPRRVSAQTASKPRRHPVAFPLRREGKACVHAILSDGTGLRRLSAGPADYEPALSADGRTLAYYGSSLGSLHVRDIASGETRLLAEVKEGGSLSGPRISDDGKVIVYLRDHTKVFVTRTDGSTPRFVSEMFPRAGYHGVAISGDGRRIAFGTAHVQGDAKPSRPVGELYLMDADGSNLKRLTANGPRILDISPSLSRDGMRLAYMSGNNPDWEIWVARSDGTGKRNVSRHKASDSSPAISPDGTRVAFESDRNGKRHIYTVGFDGKGLTQLTDGELQCVSPRFSPDGTVIFFETCRKYTRKDVCVMDADGRGRKVLVRDMFRDNVATVQQR